MALEFLDIEPKEGLLNGGQFLCLSVYDMLRELGMKDNALVIVKKFKTLLQNLGNLWGESEGRRFVVLQVNDNRFVWFSEFDKHVFDLKELSFVEHCPSPLLFVGIVLPELFQRGVEAILSLRDQNYAMSLQKQSGSNPASGS